MDEFEQEFEDEELTDLASGIKPNSYFSTDEYLTKSRKEKESILWDHINSTKGTSHSFPGLEETVKIFLADNSISFTTKGDVMH